MDKTIGWGLMDRQVLRKDMSDRLIKEGTANIGLARPPEATISQGLTSFGQAVKRDVGSFVGGLLENVKISLSDTARGLDAIGKGQINSETLDITLGFLPIGSIRNSVIRNIRKTKPPIRNDFQNNVLKENNIIGFVEDAKKGDALPIELGAFDKDVTAKELGDYLHDIAVQAQSEGFAGLKVLESESNLFIEQSLKKQQKDPRLRVVGSNSLILPLQSGKTLKDPLSLESLKIGSEPSFIRAFHGTTRKLDDTVVEGAIKETGAFHVGTFKTAQERVGLRSGGLALGGLSGGKEMPHLNELVSDTKKIAKIGEPVDEALIDINILAEKLKKKGFSGLAYINRAEGAGDTSIMLWDKNIIKKSAKR